MHVPVHELVSRMAEQIPTEAALEQGGRKITYGELEEKANVLANALLASGAQAHTVVALLLVDPIDIIVCMLGCLKARCVFVPLEPELPDKRLISMLTEAAPQWVITTAALQERLDDIVAMSALPVSAICLHREKSQTERYQYMLSLSGDWIVSDTTPCHLETEPDDICYIYFTSGSTGKPKGIAGRLKAIDHFIQWEIHVLHLSEGVRGSQLIAPSFDAFLRDVFVPLCAGGTVCIPSDRSRIVAFPKELRRWLDEEHIHIVHCVPSLLRALLNEGLSATDFASLHSVLLSGEALHPSDVRKWMDVFGERIQLVNLYGPSETTMVKFYHFVRPLDRDLPSIPIGKPMPGARAILLDEQGNVCPPGAVGEIYIRTPYRSLGYYRQPELTAEVFIPNPFQAEASDIIYKTGDLARISNDGIFELLGRKDQQIKVRGIRIELREIENALLEQPDISDAYVIDTSDKNGNGSICAYIVSKNGRDSTEIKNDLLQILPAYMIPAFFVQLEKLPRTITGKVDRQALPEPQIQKSHSKESREGDDQIEEMLASIWQQLLHIERIEKSAEFMALGGHSLLAIQLLSRLHDIFGVEVSLKEIFSASTIMAQAELIRAKQKDGQESRPPLCKRTQEAALPLSFEQQRLWFLSQLDPDDFTYTIPVALRLTGKLNVHVLQRCLDTVVQRHESLRTTFATVSGLPVQVIVSSVRIHLPVVDMQAVANDALELQRLTREQLMLPFDLSEGPLLRVVLSRLHIEEHLLCLTMHHIISDGWSMMLFIQEVGNLYAAYSIGESAVLPALPIQYADYALWQRQWLQGEILDQQLSYWRQRLQDLPVLQLPTDKARPPFQTFRGARQSYTLSQAQTQVLRELSLREEVTVFMALFAVFRVLLSRYSQQLDIAVGVPVAGRGMSEVEHVIGFFVNTLVLRVKLEGNPQFSEFLRFVRAAALDAYAHQDIPFERLVEALQPERNLGYQPLVQVLFSLQNVPEMTFSLPGLTTQLLEIDNRSAKFDLHMSVVDDRQRLRISLEYNTDLFEEETITRLLEHFQHLLENCLVHPQWQLSNLSMLGEQEERDLLQRWNQTRMPLPETTLLHELFEQQEERTPDAIALSDEEVAVSYREVNRRANRLAHALRRLGVGPETRVGVCLRRSPELVCSLLAVLKAGGAYVPLEPDYPQERLKFLLNDAQVGVVLTGQEEQERLGVEAGSVLDVEQFWSEQVEEAEANPVSSAHEENLAYVIYTSGSTGQPKGVMIAHRSAVSLMYWARTFYAPTNLSGVLAATSLCFDLSVFELFVPLSWGGKVILVEDLLHIPSREFLYDVSLVNTVPSGMQALLNQGEIATGVQVINLAGEPLSLALAHQLYRRQAACQVFNLYGPSEATTYSTCALVPRDGQENPSIGTPLANTEVYILDQELNLVPKGIAGELYIGGVGLARGYYHRPALTAERFVPHPFSTTPGMRLYRTGDHVRYRKNGEIEFLGRVDQQVKLRGYRIELGEIETIISEHPAVQECIVVAYGDGTDKYLVAYVVLAPAWSSSSNELYQYLRARLPNYMIPSRCIIMQALPHTLNGKIDRQALPEPDRDSAVQANGIATVNDLTQDILAAIWCELLRREHIGIADNFFEAGGHSLLATQVIARIREVFQINLPLRALFEAPTIAELAPQIDPWRRIQPDLSMPRILPAADERSPIPLSFAQERLWFMDQLSPGNPAYHLPGAVRLDGRLDVSALQKSFDALTLRHEILRTVILSGDGQPYQVIAPAAHVPLKVIDLSRLKIEKREEEAQQLTTLAARRPFDLKEGPLLRAELLRLTEAEHLLLLTAHHIVFDGWSLGIFMREIGAFYTSFSRGSTPALAPLAIQYRDYACWQRQWLQSETAKAQLAYWQRQLKYLAPLALPIDKSRPKLQNFRGDRHWLAFSQSLTKSLKKVGNREGATLFMTLLAAFQVVLSFYSEQDDIAVGTSIANRTHKEVEPLIGCFVNTLVLRVKIPGNLLFRDLLTQVREVTLEAYAHQDVPFEKVVEELNPERALSRHPLFQVHFVLQNFPWETLNVPDLSMHLVGMDIGGARYDLLLSLTETSEGLSGFFTYDTSLFDATTIFQMSSHLDIVLNNIATKQDISLGELKSALVKNQEEMQIKARALSKKANSHLLGDFMHSAVKTPLSKHSVVGVRKEK
jgi:amino acid adenylation domain-containing protein